MVFSSLYFLFLFLPVVLAAYGLAPQGLKNVVLLGASIFFYAWGEPVYVALMLFSAALNYVFGLDIGLHQGWARRGKLILALAVNLLLLGFFKYYVFCVDTVNQLFRLSIPYRALGLPIGISFYTFQSLSYLVDVYRGKVEAQRSVIKFALYLTMFPQLIAGPIVKYSDIETQLDRRRVTAERFGTGMDRFVRGLAKKVLLANQLGLVYTAAQTAQGRSVLTAWVGIFAYTLQIYFDFSGYSDMAIGLGRMFGFTFSENFDHPYCSGSVTEFWRRWHISLSSWFRDYVYIPLGGNRVARWKQVRNLLVVWGLTGLWHGASWNFVLWGLYYGLLLLAEKHLLAGRLEALSPALRHGLTMLLVMIGWVFFSSTALPEALGYLGNLVGIGARGLIDRAGLYSLRSNGILLALGWFAALPGPGRRFRALTKRRPAAAVALDAALFLLCMAYLVSNSYNPFLYFRF